MKKISAPLSLRCPSPGIFFQAPPLVPLSSSAPVPSRREKSCRCLSSPPPSHAASSPQPSDSLHGPWLSMVAAPPLCLSRPAPASALARPPPRTVPVPRLRLHGRAPLPSAHSSVRHGWAHGQGGPNPHPACPGLDPAPGAQLRPPSLVFPELALNLLVGPPSPISDCALLLLAMAPSPQPGRSSLQLELPPPMDVCSSSLSSRSSLCSPHLSPWRTRPSTC
jgi:hypothetical protein